MYFTEKLENLYEEIRVTIINTVGAKGTLSDRLNEVTIKITDDDLQFNLGETTFMGSDKYLVEVGCHVLIDNNGYQYNFSVLDYDDLCALVDHLTDL